MIYNAFDAFVEYVTHTGTRFVGVETKYAENLSASSISVRQVYRNFTGNSGFWLDGAATRLDTPELRQFWLNTLLAQSLCVVGHDGTCYEDGLEVVVACGADESAAQATHRVRDELHEPDHWLRWVPYEDVLAHLDSAIPWVDDFRTRYLDFAPVSQFLAADDPRAP
ncbi:MAG: PGN_0703 family putative restriction endonuclease [Actinomycetes bacterium]